MKIRTENDVRIEVQHDAKELGEVIAESDSAAQAEFFEGLAVETRRWDWSGQCLKIADEMNPAQMWPVIECLETLVQFMRENCEQEERRR